MCTGGENSLILIKLYIYVQMASLKKKKKKKKKKKNPDLSTHFFSAMLPETFLFLFFWPQVGLIYQCSENKGADQLCNYCTADLRLCFRIWRLWFSNAVAQISYVCFRNTCVLLYFVDPFFCKENNSPLVGRTAHFKNCYTGKFNEIPRC